jgi:flagellin
VSSINTNIAAITALHTLTQTNKSLLEIQKHVSTGLRVGEASDNAAYWSIATTMRSDNSALATVLDAIGLGSATIDVTYTAMKAAIEVVDQIKSKLVAAREPGLDRAKIQSDISALQDHLKSIADSAVFSGENWLRIDTTANPPSIDKSVVASFARAATGVSVGLITFSLYTQVPLSTTALFDDNATAANKQGLVDRQLTVTSGATITIATLDISGITDTAADLTDLDDMIKAADSTLADMTDAATTLGSIKSRLSLQKEFIKSLIDAITTGIGALVDADMNEESTKLQAMQVKQQLGVQALSIANATSQSILRLFQ